jgi:YVTN family beta-propeller protein
MIVVGVALIATRSQAPVAAHADTTAPSVTITSPAAGARVDRTVTISAAASDAVGVASVTFRLDGAVIGSDAKPPYTVRWNTREAASGSHTLRAEARDAAGNVGISATVIVTTGAVTEQLTKAVFEPSADSSLVTRYRLDVFLQGSDPATASPVATQDLGKPPIVNGESTADITPTTASLPAATYIATVTAVASSATARSVPSAPFVIAVTSTARSASTRAEPGASVADSHGVLWVTNSSTAMVTAFDATTGDVLATVPVGLRPAGIATPKGVGKIYVADQGSDTVSVISKATMTLSRSIQLPPPFGRQPDRIHASPDGRFVYVAERGANVVDVIDTATDEISARFSTGLPGSKTRVVVPAPSGAVLYAVNQGAAPSPGTLVAMNAETGSWLWQLPLEGDPDDFLITADGRRGVVTRQIDRAIDLVDLERHAVIKELALSLGHRGGPLQFALNGRLLLVALDTTPAQMGVVDLAAMTVAPLISLAGAVVGDAPSARDVFYIRVAGSNEFPPGVVAVDPDSRTAVRRFRLPGGGSPYAAVLDAQ